MSRFTSKSELIEDATTARATLERLLDEIPAEAKTTEVVDGMSVKDFLAHRTEWGRMKLRWYAEAKRGETTAFPAEQYTWRQLNELNAEIHRRFEDIPLSQTEGSFTEVHDELLDVMGSCSEDELFTTKYYSFTGSSDLATYFTSATGGHYRSAHKHINRWWRANRSDWVSD